MSAFAHPTVLEDSTITITSFGNGTAYAFLDNRTGMEGFVQGDDAILWEAEYESMMVAHGWPRSVWYARSWDECLDALVADYLAPPEASPTQH